MQPGDIYVVTGGSNYHFFNAGDVVALVKKDSTYNMWLCEFLSGTTVGVTRQQVAEIDLTPYNTYAAAMTSGHNPQTDQKNMDTAAGNTESEWQEFPKSEEKGYKPDQIDYEKYKQFMRNL